MQIVGSVSTPHKLVLPQESIPRDWDGILCFKLRDDFLGVAEFSAPHGCIVVPEALMAKYGLEIGDKIDVQQVELPKGSHITLKSQESLDWKHVLEQYLPRHFTTLQEGQEITVEHNGTHKITVVKCEPEPAICIIDTDLDLELNAPDVQPPTRVEYGSFQLHEQATQVPKGLLKVDGVAFVGPLHATSKDSYSHRVTGEIQMDDEFEVCGEGSATISDGTQSVPTIASSSAPTAGQSICPYCHNPVPPQSMIPHQAFCSRNTVKCPDCEATFHKVIPDNHWHCAECGHSETNDYQQSHIREHQYETCVCGYKSLFKDVSQHRTTTCPQKYIICQFCHLLVPQGEENPVNRIQGYSEHEASCGTKTTNCPQCNKVVMVRNLANHLLQHDQIRRDRAVVSPTICSNVNCPNLTATPGKELDHSHLGLCDACYGVVYVSQHDPDQSKLKARIERRYTIQLTKGCGNSWCANKECASGTGVQTGFKEAIARAKELISEDTIWLCVDRNTSRRALFLTDEPEYSIEWKGMAITMCSSEADARTWLAYNAPRLDGS